MRLALIVPLAVSLALHALVLFAPQPEFADRVGPPPLMAELRPAAMPPAAPGEAQPASPPPPKPVKAAKPAKPARPGQAARAKARPASASPVLSVPAADTFALAQDALPAAPAEDAAVPQAPAAAAVPEVAEAPPVVDEAPPPPRLPPRGTIRYRVDRGDSNFEIGYAEHSWAIADGRYRLNSVAETTGLVWLFKSVRIEMESRGRLTAAGLQPQVFTVHRNGRSGRERADFDWESMTVRVGDRGEQPLDEGAQDLLSFNYQLGYLAYPGTADRLPIATGKKYEVYRLEVIGDEQLDLPAGPMRTVHLRAPGTNARDSTELWLAYDYLLLPVKIRYLDAQGASYVQVATKILVGDGDGDGTRSASARPDDTR